MHIFAAFFEVSSFVFVLSFFSAPVARSHSRFFCLLFFCPEGLQMLGGDGDSGMIIEAGAADDRFSLSGVLTFAVLGVA